MRYGISFALLTTAILLASSNQKPKTPRQIEVSLGGSIAKVEGFEWPKYSGQHPSLHAIEHPSHVAVTFSDGQRWETYSRTTLLGQANGQCRSIILAILDDGEKMPAVQAALSKVVREIGITDKAMLAKVSELTSKPPPWSPVASFLAIGRLREATEVAIRVRPTSGKDKWYISIELYDLKQYE